MLYLIHVCSVVDLKFMVRKMFVFTLYSGMTQIGKAASFSTLIDRHTSRLKFFMVLSLIYNTLNIRIRYNYTFFSVQLTGIPSGTYPLLQR